MKDLKDTLRQRDNEISILVNMLKKEKKRISEQSNGIKSASNDDTLTDTGSSFKPKARQILKDMSMGKQEAFEIFKRDYQGNVEIEEQKRFLKNSYAEAKLLGELINTTRNKLNNLKSKSEQIYLKLEATNSLNDEKQTVEYDALHKTMEYEKENYRLNFEKLKNLKNQIEHAQYLVEKASVRLQKDFDVWWTEQCELIEAKNNKFSEQPSHVVTSTSRGPGKQTIDSASSVASSIQSINSSAFQSQGGSRPNSSLNSTAMSQSYYNQEQKLVLNESNINNKPRVFAYLDSDKANTSNLSSIASDSAKINLTGDNQIDADITAFINARKRIINQMKPN